MFERMRKSVRGMRNLERVQEALPPDEAVVLDADYDEPDLVRAGHAAWAGDWAPAARLLESTRRGGDWELRGHHSAELAEAALDADGWLRDWAARMPDDPNVLLLLGEHLIDLAWEARGGKLATYTSEEQFGGFFHYLGQVEPALRRAAAANPGDPAPWGLMVLCALGSQGGRRDLYDEAWTELLSRDPFNRRAHFGALQYLCAKWHGSDDEMFAFAYGASDAAPAGSPLHLLPLRAWLEYDTGRRRRDADGYRNADVLGSAECRAAVDRAQAACPPGRPAAYRWERPDRGLLVRTLFAQDRFDEAYGHLLQLGPHAASYPWNQYSGDPLDEYLTFRSAVILKVAEAGP